MKIYRFGLMMGVLVLCSAGGTMSCRGSQVDMELVGRVRRMMEERGIPVDTNAAARAAVEVMIKAADPGGRLVIISTNEASSRAQAGEGEQGAPQVQAEEGANGICYLSVAGMEETTGRKGYEYLVAWAKQGKRGVVLDLRGSHGNDLDSVDEIARLFAVKGKKLYTVRDRLGRDVATHKSREGAPFSLPVVALIDGETRGAAEILSAVLKDSAGLVLIGSPTKGDAWLREEIPVGEGVAVLMATKDIVLKDGSVLGARNVVPDIEVQVGSRGGEAKPGPEAAGAAKQGKPAGKADFELRAARDPVLQRALDILVGLKVIGSHASSEATNHTR